MRILTKNVSPYLAVVIYLGMNAGCVSQWAYQTKPSFTPPPRSMVSPVKFFVQGSTYTEGKYSLHAEAAAEIYPGLFTTDSNAIPLSVSGLGGGYGSNYHIENECLTMLNVPLMILTLGIIPGNESYVSTYKVTAQIPDVRDRGLLSRRPKEFLWQTRERYGNILSPFAHIPLSKPYDFYKKGSVKKGKDIRRETKFEAVAAILSESDLEAIGQLYYQNTFKP